MLCLKHRLMRKSFPVLFAFFFLGAFLFSSPKEALATDLPCTAFRNEGFLNYFFDNFEETEYQNGRLAYHFKLRDNVYAKDGRPWGSRMFFYDANCVEVGSFGIGANSNLNASITPQTIGFSVRFASSTHYDIWNDDLGLKENCEACSVDIPAVLPEGKEYRYVVFRGIIDGGASMIFSTSLPVQATSSPPESSPPDPVIIIPGILGSSDKNGVWVIDPIFHTYDDLIETLKANGYAEGANLFTMPYDWRQSNVLTAVQLENKIDEVQQICQCDKVDLVAHSMGGLVARQYIQSDRYENDVDQLIFLGTPHLGAPKAYLMWEGGTAGVEFDIFELIFNAWIRQRAIEAGFGGSKPLEIIFNYIHNPSSPILSLQELLPVYSYLKDFDTGAWRDYPSGHPQNAFLENLGADSSLTVLEQSGAKITNIFSDSENNTINFLEVQNDLSTLPLWEHGVPKAVERGSGDGTVPPISSLAITPSNSTNTSENPPNVISVRVAGEHRSLPSNTADEIVEILTGELPTTIVHTSPIKRFLSIFGLSPIDILVTAPDGKRIGKDFASGQEVQEINEIEGAFYSGFNTQNENIFIPDPLDGEYIITTQGTGEGVYEILTDYIREEATGEATSTTASFAANTATGLVAELNLSVDSSNPQNLNIQPADVTPPEISIISPEARDYLRSEILSLNISITDSESGVFSSEIKFDDRIVNNGESVDLFFEKLGTHRVSVSASDFIGNAADAGVNFQVIATIQSTISDIERAYSLGWIIKKSVKNTLIGKLERIDTHNRPLTPKTLKTFLVELEREHPRNINDLAYNLLKEDINWMLNN